ncbi:MAG: hypothetical protein AB7F35_14100 [Acetobacteraceae bacterium]
MSIAKSPGQEFVAQANLTQHSPAFCVLVFGLSFSEPEGYMNSIIYIIGLIVVIVAILSFLGLT